MRASLVRKVCIVGNYVPRKCGLATFTSDLAEATANQEILVEVAAVNDRPEGYPYQERVKFEIDQHDLKDYLAAAQFMNFHRYDLACIQHEYGIYGGEAGEHILHLMRNLHMPIVTTLHTVLESPTPDQKRVLDEIIQLSQKIVVMSRRGAQMLQKVHQADPSKIEFVHHGVPVFTPEPIEESKKRFGLEGKNVILTFGLLSPGKGLEYMIEAMPRILSKHPETVYLIVGATHPHICDTQGECYRESLINGVKELQIEDNVQFVNRYTNLPELVDYLKACDIFVTPYLNREQVTSGTLSYAVGCGKAVVSTNYWHAEELLSDGRGVLVPTHDSMALADAVEGLFSSTERMASVKQKAAELAEEMSWPNVGATYKHIFEVAKAESRTQLLRIVGREIVSTDSGFSRPGFDLRHLRALTDDTGLFQHATYDVPNRLEGYCTDDNARGLLLVTILDRLTSDVHGVRELGKRYLSFLHHAFNPNHNRFRNFLSFNREWLEEAGSEDSHARALWSLGYVASFSRHSGFRSLATELFQKALPPTTDFSSPRAWAFTLFGLKNYLNTFSGDRSAKEMFRKLSSRLLRLYKQQATADWPWFEDILAYDNARLPEALILAGEYLDNPEMLKVGTETLEWLLLQQKMGDNIFCPIGSSGFYRKGQSRALYDQQPVEVGAVVDAFARAFLVTGKDCWKKNTETAFAWFLGQNLQLLPMVDEKTGGCYDGLQAGRVNENQGAESTLAYLLALAKMHELDALETPGILYSSSSFRDAAIQKRDRVPSTSEKSYSDGR